MLPYRITPDTLIWDEWNIEHIARHDVTMDEVEETCNGRFIILQGYAGRAVVVGETFRGRALAIVVEPDREEMYYVVTARPASRTERRIYRENIG